jgi:hypothetical protein
MLPALAVFALPALVHAATPLKLTQSHQGSTFFDGKSRLVLLSEQARAHSRGCVGWKVNGSDTDATQ